MKNYFKALLYIGISAVIFAGITFTGCTDVDDNLGLGLLPEDQDMQLCTYTMTDGGIDTYLGKGDFGFLKTLIDKTTEEFKYIFVDKGGLPTDKTSTMRIGSMHTNGYGKIYGAFMGQFVPRTFFLNNGVWPDDYFGPNAYENIDSVIFNFTITRVHGKADVEQKFYIYELTKLLDNKQSYYPNIDPTEYTTVSKPIFSFTLKNENLSKVVYKELKIEEPYGSEFLKKLVGIQDMKLPDLSNKGELEVPYKTDSLFRSVIKGYYIAPADPKADAAIYEIVLAGNNQYARVDQSLFYIKSKYEGTSFKNENITIKDTIKEQGKEDIIIDAKQWRYKDSTITVQYSFDDFPPSNVKYPSTSVGIITHDYSGSVVDESLFYDINKTNNQPVEVSRVHGMMGVYTYMKFNQIFIDELKGLLTDKGGKVWQAMMINQAKLRIWVDNPTIENLNIAPTRLGMYYGLIGKDKFNFNVVSALKDYWTMDSIQTFSPNYIPDYAYPYENPKSPLTYGGYLSRSSGFGYYDIDISMLLRKVANASPEEMEEVNKGVWIGPAMTAGAIFNTKQVGLRNDFVTDGQPAGATVPNDPAYNPSVKRFKVDLVYTLMKPKEKK